MKKITWSDISLEILHEISKPFELLTQEKPFPPSEQVAESFIDKLSMYGFHIGDFLTCDRINSEGMFTPKRMGNYYFINDRYSAKKRIDELTESTTHIDLDIISADEYFQRLLNSVESGIEMVCTNTKLEWKAYGRVLHSGYGLLIIDRNKAIPEERKEQIAAGQVPEFRGKGFYNGYYSAPYKPILDEGAVTWKGQSISPSALRGALKIENTPDGWNPKLYTEVQPENILDVIKDFYEAISKDYMKFYSSKGC